jgi:hypothetical protein
VQTRAAAKSPKKAYSTVHLKGGARKTMKAIKSYTDGIHYRKDLQGVRSFINTLVLVPASSCA